MGEKFIPPIEVSTDLPATHTSLRLIDGGFLVGSYNPARVTPTDEFTGVPSVLLPTADLPPIPSHQTNVERVADWHHPFHPRAQLINKTLGLAALRTVRKQWALYDRHHNNAPEGYHSVYDGPRLPETEAELFRTVVFAAAGYIPRLAIDFQKSEKYRLKPLSDEQRVHMWESGQIRVDNPIHVRDFLIDYALNGNFVDIKSPVVHEFLYTDKLERRVQLGNELLRAAAYESAISLSSIYRKAKREELIPVYTAHSAGQFVMSSMGLARGRQKAHKVLKARLQAA